VIQNHSHRPGADLGRELVGRLACHGSTFSGVGASDQPGAVHSAPEFTVLCAVTGQPDFAHVMIEYVPKDWLIESKALKYFLASFRNQSGFHEETTIAIGSRLTEVLEPVYLRVGG
jgi:7-cyano-7-deazaguanine reductase